MHINNLKKKHETLPKPVRQHSPRLEAGLFLLIVLIEAGIFFYLIHGRRIVGGHDGFQYFTLQYYFLNNVVNYSEIPQWMPFLTHGTVATWWHIIQGGILQSILLLSGSFMKAVNFLPLFYAGMSVDELLLLVGIWFLGRRVFASPVTICFVAVSIMGSCVWLLQPWWNFHLYYAIPLILYFVHMFLDSGKWRYGFLAGNLFFIQSLGNLPYFLPTGSLAIFLYFLFYFFFNRKDTWQKIKMIWSWPLALITLLIGLLFGVLYAAMTFGTGQIENYTFRSTDGTSSLDLFLAYGGKATWRAWLEIAIGVSPGLDYTLYIGVIGVPLILAGIIFNLKKKNVHFLLTAIVLLLFSAGTFVSVFFYYCWPMMKYFRHLMLVAPIIKVLLCFLAGFGFEAVFFNSSRGKNPLVIRIALAVTSILMLGLAFTLWRLTDNHEFTARLFGSMVPDKLYRFLILSDDGVMASFLGRAAFFAFTTAVLFAVLSFTSRKKFFIPFAGIVLILHGVDIYGFKFSEIRLKAAPLKDETYAITEFQTMPYAKRRDIAFDIHNSRIKLLNALPIKYGAFYWTAHALFFMDELGNPFKTDHLLSPLDQYMKAYWGQSINDKDPPLGLFPFSHLEFPRSHPAALKISGVTEDKIQFFCQADVLYSEEEIAANITSVDYAGDLIFLSPLEKNQNTHSVSRPEFSEKDLSSDKRLRLPYQVLRFDSNHLEVTTDIEDLDSAWLLYSDVWHPFWRATVNGKKTPVYKANLAYKAVRLEKGANKVHFYFRSDLVNIFHLFVGLNSMLWLIIIIYMAGKVAFKWGEVQKSQKT